MVIDSLKGITIVGASAGHRHSMLLDDMGGLYTFGTGSTGALGHGNHLSQSYPMKVMEFGQSPIFCFGVTQTNSDGKCRAHNSILFLFQ
jgi:alpha-tubulin suppressor-like RCC1 family protein